jgi:hypothetical protein
MTLPASGAISFSNINTELGFTSTAQISMNDANVRTLFGQASGAICMNTGHGKSNTSVPGVPTGVSASATGSSTASVSFSAPACTGHLSIDLYRVKSSPGCFTATGASSPITVSGLTALTSYTFRVQAHNSLGYGCYSSSSSSITTPAPAYMCITTSGATVYTCGNYKTAVWTGSGSFTVNSLGSSTYFGNQINIFVIAGGGGGGGLGGGGAGAYPWFNDGSIASGSGQTVTARTYGVTVGGGGAAGSPSSPNYGGTGTLSRICCLGTASIANLIQYGAGSGQSNTIDSSSAKYSGGGPCFRSGKCCYSDAGGGGAGSGQNGFGGQSYYPSLGKGGNGGGYLSISSIFCVSGRSLAYGGGGGGGYASYKWNGTQFGGQASGGGAGAGAGGVYRYPQGGCAGAGSGAASTGSGGGGAGHFYVDYGGSGGSGIALIRWRFQ